MDINDIIRTADSACGGGKAGPETMKHPFRNYTTEDALSLARDCRYGPLPKESDPTPTIDEAIKIICNDPTMKSCNWITGQTAVQVLRGSRGEKVEFT